MLDVTINIDRIEVLTRLIGELQDRAGMMANIATTLETKVRDHLEQKYVPRTKRRTSGNA